MIFATVLILYGRLILFAIKKDSFAEYWQMIVVLVTVAFVIAMIYTGYKRMNEIDKEDKDDISKY